MTKQHSLFLRTSTITLAMCSLLNACSNTPEKDTVDAENPASPQGNEVVQNPNRPQGQNGPPNGHKGLHNSTTQNPMTANKNGPPGMPGMSASEDLTGSWNEGLSMDNIFESTSQQVSNCPDNDGDGFKDARFCGEILPIDQVDCDDQNPTVTPKTERYVKSGRFIMGSVSTHAGKDESPVHLVEVSGYCLDVQEVRSLDFAKWISTEKITLSGSDIRNFTNNVLEDGRGNFPVEGVTWQEANAYCTWKGQSLPTEAQWEKAARGGCELGKDPQKCDEDDLRAYPWGNDMPTCENSNHQVSSGGMPQLCVSDTLADNLKNGVGPYGHEHLAGNVWEYVVDIWHPSVYSAASIRQNPKGPKPQNQGQTDVHVLRGGGWNTFSTNMRAANRFHDLILGSASGFRCARSFVEGNFDNVEPLVYSSIEGVIQSSKPLNGRAMYVTAFDAADADAQGMLAPGRSPIAEIKLTPNGQNSQSFAMDLPNGTYILSAALDAGGGAQKDAYVSASGSGGFGKAQQNPVTLDQNRSDIVINLQLAPIGGPMPANKLPSPKKP